MRARVLFPLIALIHVIYLLRPSVEISDSKIEAEESIQIQTFIDKKRTPNRGYLKEGICYGVKGHNCKTVMWMQQEMELIAGPTYDLKFRVQQGLVGNSTISLLSCGPNPQYVVQNGSSVYLSKIPSDNLSLEFSKNVSFLPFKDYYNINYFALQIYTDDSRNSSLFIVNRKGKLVIEEVRETNNPHFTHNVTWMFTESADIVDPNESVHFLESPIDSKVKLPPPVFDDEHCHRGHKGCCSAKDTRFITPTESSLGPYTSHDVTVLVVSSFNTIAARKPLLERWLIHGIRNNIGPWKQAVITLDCYSHDIDTSWPHTDWLVGPSFTDSPEGISVNTIRVNIALHWMFLKYVVLSELEQLCFQLVQQNQNSHRKSAFYFMVDDDTLVFSNHMTWALSYLSEYVFLSF